MLQKFQQRKTRRGWETAARWTWSAKNALLKLVAGAALGAAATSVAQTGMALAPANTVASLEEDSGPQTVSRPARPFNIPAGPLPSALDEYHKVTGLHVRLKMPADQLAGFRTAGAQGTLTNDAALRQLLTNTGLSFHFEGADTVEIAIRSSEHVEVTTSVDAVALQQFPQQLLDTAQTVNTVPQYVLQEQAVTGLRDGLRNVPGISLAAGEGGSQGDTLTIRGFNARNDIFLDGIRDFGSYYRDAFDYQSIDVLEGPASVEFGRGSTGGVVNQETKQPELDEFVRTGVQLGTDAMRRVTADIDEPIKEISGGAAFRVNVAGEETRVSERDIAHVRRFGIAPALAFGLDTKTRYYVNYLHEAESDNPDYGLPYFGAGVVAAPRTTYYGFAADNYLRSSPDVLTGKVEHDFGTRVTVRNTLRFANYPRDVRITEPQVNTVAALTYGGAGKASAAVCDPTLGNDPHKSALACYPVTTPLAQVQVKRNQLVSNSTEDILWDQVSATARFTLAHIENSGVLIVEGGRERSRPTRNSYTMPYVSVLTPNPDGPFVPVFAYPAVPTHVETQSFGLGFLDTLRLTQWLLLSGGVRFDYFNTNSHNPANPAALSSTGTSAPTAAAVANRLDKQPTYRASVVVKPKPQGSIYFDYGTSFNPSAESLSLSANNATSPPEYNETFELGAKWAYLHDRLSLDGSVFRTEKINARETDPNNSNNTINSGNQLIRGVQLGVLGHLPSNFDIVLGYAYLDGRLESSIVNASPFAAISQAMFKAGDPRWNTAPYFINPTGFPLANVPKNSGNAWVTHRIGWRFVGGFGGSYVGARRASSTSLIGVYNSAAPVDPTTVPLVAKAIAGYTLLNAMLKRPISDRLELQVNVNNLTNAYFIDQPHPNHLVPGEGVNGQFSLNYKF